MALILLLVQAKLWLLGSAGDPPGRGEGDRIDEEEEEEEEKSESEETEEAEERAYFDLDQVEIHVVLCAPRPFK